MHGAESPQTAEAPPALMFKLDPEVPKYLLVRKTMLEEFSHQLLEGVWCSLSAVIVNA
jgi:hypothetical protein